APGRRGRAHAEAGAAETLRASRRGSHLSDRRRDPPARGRRVSLHDAWTALRHGGNLLSPVALDALPEPDEPAWDLADRLRGALVALDPEKPAAAVLDTVLEDACGLRDRWQKGNALGAAE